MLLGIGLLGKYSSKYKDLINGHKIINQIRMEVNKRQVGLGKM